jgi:hypothetical protein
MAIEELPGVDFLMSEWQGIVVRCVRHEEIKWNQQVIADCLIQGLSSKYPPISESGGSAQIRISSRMRLERIVGGSRSPATLEDLMPGTKVQVGFFSFTEQGLPVVIYPDSLLILS